jgi:hypothetical protein
MVATRYGTTSRAGPACFTLVDGIELPTLSPGSTLAASRKAGGRGRHIMSRAPPEAGNGAGKTDRLGQ